MEAYKHPFKTTSAEELPPAACALSLIHILWRQGKHLPKEQGIVVGCVGSKGGTTALIDTGDVHALMIGAAGVGKTAYWLYPCIEYACASGMSFLSTDTKGDVMRNYGTIADVYKRQLLPVRNI